MSWELRFYIGIPLTTADGHSRGTFNVIDVEPRELTAGQLDRLEDLAAIVMDELELRLTARRTVELEAAREAAAFRRSLLAGISPEMRTSVAVLHGTINLEADDRQDTDQIHAVQRRHVTRLGWLINQVPGFTTLEAGRALAVNVTPIDLAPLAIETVEPFTDRADIDLPADLPTVPADADRGRQILIELLNNADRFSPAGATSVCRHRSDRTAPWPSRSPTVDRASPSATTTACSTRPTGPGTAPAAGSDCTWRTPAEAQHG